MNTDALKTGHMTLALRGANDAAVPGELLLIPVGTVETTLLDDRGNEITYHFDPADAPEILHRFRDLGHDVVIDYEHATDVTDERHDGTAPAAGWIKDLRFEPERGIIAVVDWTALARQRIAAREYRYCSPTIYTYTRADGTRWACGLRNVGLTNQPATKGIQPIAAKRRAGANRFSDRAPSKGDPAMGPLFKLLGLDDGATLDQISAALTDENLSQVASLLGLDPGASKEEILAAIGGALGIGSGAGESGYQQSGGQDEVGMPLKAVGRVSSGVRRVTLGQLAAKAGVAGATTIDAIVEGVQARAAKEQSEMALSMKALSDEVGALRKRAADADFDKLIAMKENRGKITPAMEPFYREDFHRDPKRFTTILAKMPVVAGEKSELDAPARGGVGGGDGEDRHPYLKKVDETIAAKKCKKLDAIAIVQREHKDLFDDYLESKKRKTRVDDGDDD